MFSPDIVGSDAFIDMPISSQALYFHLGMYADDDGFVNPKRIVRMVGLADDDLKVLTAKRFILPFENGVIVIKHWKINNLVRKDWYKETKYVEQKSRLKTKDNGAYTELVNEPLTTRSHRLGKVRLGNLSDKSEGGLKTNEENMDFKNKNYKGEEGGYDEPSLDLETGATLPPKGRKKKVTDEMQSVFDLFNNHAKGIWGMRDIERTAAQILYDKYGLETLKIRIARIEKEKGNKDPHFPLITTPSQLLDKMANVERYFGI